MAVKTSIPFYLFRLHLYAQHQLTIPMSDIGALRIGHSAQSIAEAWRDAFQQKVLNRGHFGLLLQHQHDPNFLKTSVEVHFSASSDGYSFPAFDLEFDAYYTQQSKGYWGMIPVLGLECFGEDLDKLRSKLVEAVRLDFLRKKRLLAVQDIVSCIWYKKVELLQKEVSLIAPGLKELERLREQPEKKILPLAARLLEVKEQQAFYLDKELEQIVKLLKGKFNKNTILVGSSGVGKTALINELSRYCKKHKLSYQIWETTASTLIKELMRDTGWQESLSQLCQELKGTSNILFVRNIMELFEVGKYEGNNVSIAEYLRNYISRGEIILFSECTAEEKAVIDITAPGYLQLFQTVFLEERPEAQLEQVILSKAKQMARFKKVNIEEDAIKEVLRLHQRFTPYSGMPGKPIRFLESLLIDKRSAAHNRPDEAVQVSRSEIIQRFAEESGMPVFMIDPAIPLHPDVIKNSFSQQLFGQQQAVEGVADMLASVKTALNRSGKPIASFLFVGPTGVGKTEMAKLLAGFLFGHQERLTRFDMSEYADAFSLDRLIGSPFFPDGILTATIKKEPFAVLLFDEIEKASPAFFDLLLQILSEGRLTDYKGKVVNFCSSVIIMTSNIGAQRLKAQRIGWSAEDAQTAVIAHFISEVERFFKPELVNRIDKIVPFVPLSREVVRHLVDREMEKIKNREGIKYRKVHLNIPDAVIDFLAEKGYDDRYGARQLQRGMREQLLIPLSKALNEEEFDDQLDVAIYLENQKIAIDVRSNELSFELLFEAFSRISFADGAGELRRQVQAMMDGAFYRQLLSELDILEEKKKKDEAKFWENIQQSNRYNYYLDTQLKLEALKKQIDRQEEALALSCLELNTYNPQWVQDLEQSEQAFLELKLETFSRLNPKSGICHFAIYGTYLEAMVDFYVQLFEFKNILFEAQSVWFRESYYNEETLLTKPDGSWLKGKRREYIKKAFHASDAVAYEPEKQDDVLYGIEFALAGDAVYLLLKEEAGGHRVFVNEQVHHNYVLVVENDSFKTPENIHRKDFYTKTPIRRSITPFSVKDSTYKWQREYNKNELLSLLIELLDERLKINLDVAIL
ncbi:MAG TPA: AAA family ATPase [Saprospiraceae bacterium]|nr:AAA family ATPase [Saprospiraceae bacterium]HMQ81812.1 AAA family ATPase [Saprospiraceae bacterium]